MKSLLWICFCVLLAGLVRCHNLHDVFDDHLVYFVDADCYSRMTRARLVEQQPGLVIHHHDFENAPRGIDSHATAPMDYLIVSLREVLGGVLSIVDLQGRSVIRGQELDLAGALVSPLLGMLTCAFLGLWARHATESGRSAGVVPLFFALSPILVHGTLLGRPDHQSLLILLLAVALGAEARLLAKATRFWAVVSGLAWAAALWVSLYEPLVLLGAVTLAWLFGAPKKLLVPERVWWLGSFCALSAVALFIEGWPVHPLEPAVLEYFGRWSQSIGELGHATASQLFQWLGWGLVAVPLLLICKAWRGGERRAWAALTLLLTVLGLTIWQLRWGYFLALIFAMALPWAWPDLSRRRWLGFVCFGLSLWPVAKEWDLRLFPNEEGERLNLEHRREAALLRQVARLMAYRNEKDPKPFIAPWWCSPALAYWSRQLGVAGSSHESLSGIVDTARFYLAETPEAAVPILRERQVHYVVADDPERVLQTSLALLGKPMPERPLAVLLFEQPHSVAPFLQPVFANDFFKLFFVFDTKFPP